MVKKYRLIGKIILTALVVLCLVAGFLACTKDDSTPTDSGSGKQTVEECKTHTFGDWTVTKQPTCTEDGERTHTCSVCGKKVTESLPKGHTLVAHASVAATCTTPGNTAYWTCSACGKYFSDAEGKSEIASTAITIAATSHTLIHHAAVAATCAKEGSVEYWECSSCGKKYSNAAGTAEITTISVPKTDHASLEHHASASADCDHEGNIEYWSCSVCNKKYEDEAGTHEVTSVITPITHEGAEGHEAVTPTCTMEGNIAYWVCPICSRYFSDADCKHEISSGSVGLAKVPHSFKYFEAHENSCVEQGNIEYWGCVNCNEKYADSALTERVTEVVIPPIPHDMLYHYAVSPTCEKEGNNAFYECSLCGFYYDDKDGRTKVDQEDVFLAKIDHEIVEIDETARATCVGDDYYYCKNCGATFADPDGAIPYQVEQTGHILTHHAGTPATCTASGIREYWSCSRCLLNYLDEMGVAVLEDATLPAVGHAFEYNRAVAATCTSAGIREHLFCARCNGYFELNEVPCDRTDLVLNANGHQLVEDEAVPATCTSTGLTQGFHCNVCGYVDTAQEIVEKVPHSYQHNTDGTCDVCGANKLIEITLQGADLEEDTVEITANTHFQLPVPENPGYVFVGWRLDDSNMTVLTNDEGESILPWTWNNYIDTTLVAVWTTPASTRYNVSYYNTYNVPSTNVRYYWAGYTYPLAPLTGRTGYSFTGWTIMNTTTGVASIENSQSNELYLSANWAPNQYTITFDSQGGSAVSPKTCDFNSDLNVAEFTKPTQNKKTFVGWFIKNENDELELFQGSIMPAENFTLYAKWIDYKIVSSSCKAVSAIKVSDALTVALFDVQLTDTDGSTISTEGISASFVIIDGTQEAGETITVRITITAKYGKKRIHTISGIKVYGEPTLVFGENATEPAAIEKIKSTDIIDAESLQAKGKDSFGEDTEIVVYGLHEYLLPVEVEKDDLTAAEKAQKVPVDDGNEDFLYKIEGDYVYIRNAAIYADDEWEYMTTVSGKKIYYALIFDDLSDIDQIPDVPLVSGSTGAIAKLDNYGYIMLRKAAVYESGDDAFEQLYDNDTVFNLWEYDETLQTDSYVNETFVIRSIDPAGNIKEKQISNIAVYDFPEMFFQSVTTAIKDSTELNDAWWEAWGAEAYDSFGTSLTEQIQTSVDGNVAVGQILTVTFTVADSMGNVTTRSFEVKVLGTPTLERPEKTRFIEGETINDSTLGLTAIDSVGDEIYCISVEKKDDGVALEAGKRPTYIVTVIDEAGNQLKQEITVMIYGDPIFDEPDTYVVSDHADITDATSFGITAKDDFGKELTVTVVKEGTGAFVKGATIRFAFTVSNVAGKEATIRRDYTVYSSDDIVLTYNALQGDTVRLQGNGSEFGASATGTNNSVCTISIVSANGGKPAAGTVTDIRLRATDPAGNYKDSEIISDVMVYDFPVITFDKREELYLTYDEITALGNNINQLYTLFKAVDSFGEEPDISFGEIEESAGTFYSFSVTVTAVDDAGNETAKAFNIIALDEDQSILILTVDGQRKGVVPATKGSTNIELPHEYEGYTFNGWKMGDTILTSEDGIIASWTEDQGCYYLDADVTALQYTVRLYANETSIGSIKVTYGQNYTLSIPSISTGQYFAGWLLDNEAVTGSDGRSLAVWSIAANRDLEADIITYQSVLELYDANGELFATRTIIYGESFELPVPEQSGFSFDGWYLGTTAITDKYGKGYSVWSSMGAKYTLTSRQTMQQYTVEYNLDGGINDDLNPSSYTADSVGSGFELKAPIKESSKEVEYTENYANGVYVVRTTYTMYVFEGWYAEAEFVNPISTITIDKGNLRLFAKWRENKVTTESEQTYLYNEEEKVVYFGSYPQTLVTDSTLIASLSSIAGARPTPDDSRNWNVYDFYISGNNTTNFIWYYDYLDSTSGNKYRGVYFTGYRPKLTSDESTAGKSYQDDNGYEVNSVYWFKYEPIAWKILSYDNGTVLVYSDLILDANEVNTSEGSYLGSNIDAFLLSVFSGVAFSDVRLEEMVENSDLSGRKLYLLSKEDMINASYGFSTSVGATDSARTQKVSDYAACMGAYIDNGSYAGNGVWWLRTGAGSGFYEVDYRGSVSTDACNKTYYGVVPALSLTSEILYTYDSEGDYYIVTGYHGFATDIVIPSTYNDGTHGEKAVKAIGDYAFWGSTLTSISLPVGIISIGSHAFYECLNLTGISLPTTVASIGDKAFYGCLRLVEVLNGSGLSITVGSSENGFIAYYAKRVGTSSSALSRVGDFILYTESGKDILVAYVGYAAKITIPEEAEEIGENVFVTDTNISEVTIGGNVVTIDAAAFANCDDLASVTFVDTDNWYGTDDKSVWTAKEGGTAITIGSKAQNATALKDGFRYWYKKS